MKSKIPNILTIARIFIIPIFAFLVLSDTIDKGSRYFVCFLVFVVAALTDLLDGIIARKKDSITEFGIFADPIADKILIHSALIALVFLHKISPLVEIFLVSRDILVSGIRLVIAKNGEAIAPNVIGKLKTLSEDLLVSFVLLLGDNEPLTSIVTIITIVTILLSLWSAFVLIIQNQSILIKRFLGEDN